jgi:circadian clock protein KaiC
MIKICSNCGATNESEYIFCYQCGGRLEEPVQTIPEPEEVLSCYNCGAQNPATYKFCYQCGSSMIPAYEKPAEEVLPSEEEAVPVTGEHAAETEKPEMITCPNCGELNAPEYKFCGVCGFNLVVAPEAAPEAAAEEVPPSEEEAVIATGEQAAETEKPEMITCPNCGEQNPSDYKFCGNCGFDLAATPEPAPPEKKKPVKKEIRAPQKEPPAVEDVFIAEDEVRAPTRISTGIEGLDPVINGGFLKNKVYLISGGPGTGQTIFGLQYLYSGLENGENGVYFSGDEKPEQLILDARSMGWDLTGYIEEKRLGLVDSSHYFSDLYTGKSKSIDSRAIVNYLTRQIKKLNAKRLVIDPVAPLLIGEDHCANIQDYLRNLIFAIEDSLECTTLITSGNQAGVSSFSRYGIEELVTGGIIVLSMDKRKRTGERSRTLFIPKMRGTSIELKEHTFEIQQGKGIVLLD